LPPNPPNIAHFDTGRSSRLILPSGTCPDWFKGGVKVFFVPLFWIDDLDVSDVRKLDAFLICNVEEDFSVDDWLVDPIKAINKLKELDKPENDKEGLLVYESKLTYTKQQWKLNCPPIIKGLCDEQKRVITTEHSLGVVIWSRHAFNEHYG
jgi:hypothetical protein